MTDVLVVFITTPLADAPRIAKAIVEQRLAACVNIVPGIRSIYRWQGKIEDEPEALLVAKTARDRFDALRDGVKQLHPYTVPEIIALPVVAGSPEYLAWVSAEVKAE